MRPPLLVVVVDPRRIDSAVRRHLEALVSALGASMQTDLQRVDRVAESAGGFGSERRLASGHPGDEECRADVAFWRAARDRSDRGQLITLLEESGGNLAEVARRLGVSRGAVIHRARKHGLLPPPETASPRRPRKRSRSRQ